MHSRIDFAELKERLRLRARELVPVWLPGGRIHGQEYETASLSGGKGSSLKVNLTQGVWKDFATSEPGGDLIDLYSRVKSIPTGEAARRLVEEFVGPAPLTPTRYIEPPAAFMLPPINAPAPTMVHRLHGNPSEAWPYLTAEGNHMLYLARYEPRRPDEKKQYIPWVWTADGWKPTGIPIPRPIYGLDRLAKRPNAGVLIVEGEKCADSARALAPDYVVITWPGGSSAVKKTDWSPIAGRSVVIWPDADSLPNRPYEEQPGPAAAHAIAELILPIAKEIKVLNVSDHADGWDAADAVSEGWDSAKFYAWAKSRAIPVTTPAPKPAVVETPLDPVDDDGSERSTELCEATVLAELKHVAQNKLRTPLATIENVANLLKVLGVNVRYNVISKEQERLVPGYAFSIDNQKNSTLTYIVGWASRIRMPTALVPELVAFAADQNPYNPVTTWIESKPWDEKSRLEEFYATITAKGEQEDPAVAKLKQTFMTRWMISAVAAAYEAGGISAQGVLVLQGPQAIGKTQWFKRLVPRELSHLRADGMLLRPDDKDSLKQVLSFWLVELGELDATFRKSDIAQLKAFLTRSKDVFRRPYARDESEFARRTVFLASVNPSEFLHDPTGNRRFWTIECEAINYDHGLDMQQVWAEFASLYQMGVSHALTDQELKDLNAHNENFMTRDAVEELIGTRLDWEHTSGIPSTWRTATDILQELGIDNPSHSQKMRASDALKARGARNGKKDGLSKYLAPQKLSPSQRLIGVGSGDL